MIDTNKIAQGIVTARVDVIVAQAIDVIENINDHALIREKYGIEIREFDGWIWLYNGETSQSNSIDRIVMRQLSKKYPELEFERKHGKISEGNFGVVVQFRNLRKPTPRKWWQFWKSQ